MTDTVDLALPERIGRGKPSAERRAEYNARVEAADNLTSMTHEVVKSVRERAKRERNKRHAPATAEHGGVRG
jgi:alpha-D-ribose 1-methylphosphonate 5-triphosphate synthase subunit PhnG